MPLDYFLLAPFLWRTVCGCHQAKVAAAIAGKDVGILVNNVGVSYPFPKYFHELTDDEVHQYISACGLTAAAVSRSLLL